MEIYKNIESLVAPAIKNLIQQTQFSSWVGKISWRRTWQPTPIFLPGESHEQRILAGYGPWGCRESHKDTHNIQEYTHTHTYTNEHTKIIGSTF